MVRRIIRITLKTILWISLSVIILLLLITALIRIPSVQTYVVQTATHFVSDKTNTRVEIAYVGINFPQSLVLEGVFAEDLTHDTLAYIGRLQVDVDMLALFQRSLSVSDLQLEQATVKLVRTLPDSTFNFQFIIDAFASGKPSDETDTDSTKGGFNMDAEHLKLVDTRFLFADSVNGLSFYTHAGMLELSLDEMDLDSMKFFADELMVAHTQASFTVFARSGETEEDTSTSALPQIGANKITLVKSGFVFINKPDEARFGFRVDEASLAPEFINLDKQQVAINSLLVENPMALIAMKSTPKEQEVETTGDTSSAGWQVTAREVTLNGGTFKMDMTNVPHQQAGIDYSHLYGTHIAVHLRDVFYSPQLIKGHLQHASLNEQCGLQLKKLSTRFAYDNNHAELAALRVETPRTFISNYIGITYPSLDALANTPGALGIKASLNKTKVYLQDALYFVPDLVNLPPFNGSGDKEIRVSGKLNGRLDNLDIKNLVVTAGEQTAVKLDGHITGLPDAEKSGFDMVLHTLTTTEKDLNNLVGKNYLPAAVRIPEQVMLNGTYQGSLTSFGSVLTLKSTQGNADIRATLDLKKNEIFDAAVSTSNLDLGYLLKNTSLGKTSANITVKGQGLEMGRMVAKARGEVSAIYLSGYTYQDIRFNGEANKGPVKATLKVDDKNLLLTADVTGNLSPKKEELNLLLNLAGANLLALGLSKDDLRTGASVRASVQGFDPQYLDGYIGIGGLIVASPDYRYRFDSIVVTTKNDPGNHVIDLQSQVAVANYSGTIAMDKLAGTLQQHINYYLQTGQQLPDTSVGRFTFNATVKPHPVFSDLLLPDLRRFSGVSVTSTYSSAAKQLQFKATAAQLVYAGNDIKDLGIEVNSNADALDYRMRAGSASMTSVRLPQTTVAGTIKDGIINNSIQVIEKDSGDRLLVKNEIKLSNRETVIRILDGQVVLDNRVWKVPLNNAVTIAKGGVNIQNLELRYDSGSMIRVQSAGTAAGAPIDIRFDHFNLGELSQIIENDTPLVRGDLNGMLHVQKTNPFEFTSDLSIEDVSVKNIALGNVRIKADNLTANRYTASLVLTGQDNHAEVGGYYENENLNLLVDLDRVTLKTVQAFVPSQIRESSGYLKGKISLKGKATQPDLDGSLTFHDAQMILTAINNKISMHKETISVNNTGVHFTRFTVKDESGQPLVLNGDVLTTDFMNMKFNLDVHTQNFMVMNTTARNSKEYYGKIIINSNIKIRGTQDLPVVEASVRMIEGSNFTFVVQQGELSTDIGEDIVQVIDKDTNVFFKFIDTVAAAGSTFKGIELNANIQVDHKTVFSVIVDPTSGDKLVVAGDAILNFGLDQSGKMSLTGTYTLSEGSYRASFQKVFKREFFIRNGSSITWTGDPMDANVDITAIYKTEAPSTDLLAAELQGMSDNERNAYRKLLSYEVFLMIRGELLKPDISFSINLDDKDRNAFGGMVDAKLTSLNNDPNELNKQVFALLILNKFLPPSNVNTAGNSGGTSSIARNSVNQVLSDQLNALSGRYIKGAELNVNINSNDDYTSQGTTTENTQVEVGVKKEFNDRLSVQVGGNVNVNDNSPQSTTQQNITGDVVVEYKITEDGRFRFKAFRQNNYEGLIDGMLYKTGAGIIFSKDYDKLRDLFKPEKKEEEENIVPEDDKK